MDTAAAHLELPATPAAPYWARRHAAAVLGAWQIDADTTDITLLLISELVTNAVTATAALSHATTGTPIAQMLTCQDGQIVIEITDPSPDPPVLADAGPDAEAGRGLLLVQALTKEWACCYRTCGGKTIRCALPLPDITTQPAPPAAPPPGP